MRSLKTAAHIGAVLAVHDLRLAFRRLFARFSRLRPATVVAIVGGALLTFHLLAWAVAGWLATAQAKTAGDMSLPPALAAAALLIMPWLVSQAVNGAARALYARGDLDLVLTAPIPPSAVLGARCLAIAAESLVSVLIFAGPIADAAALRAGPRWLAIYPALAASALFATALGAAVTFALFRAVGPRRTRFLAQLAGAAIGAVFLLSLQVASVLPVWLRTRLFTMFHPARDGLFAQDGLLWLPIRAAAGEPRDLVLWCLVSLTVFTAAIALLGPPFVAFAAQAAGTAADRPREARRAKPMAFGAGEGKALRSKEWRLLRRDPWLLSQICLQVIYTLPIGVLIWRSPVLHGSIAFSAGPTIVVIACQVSASFAWLVISSEEAPDLLRASPVSRRAVEIRKLQAIAPPLAMLLGPPLLILAWFEPKSAGLTLAFAVCAAASSALLNFWHPMPGRRTEVLRRHSQSKLVGLMEHLLSLAWAVAFALALFGSALTLAPIAFAALLLYVNRPGRSQRRLAA